MGEPKKKKKTLCYSYIVFKNSEGRRSIKLNCLIHCFYLDIEIDLKKNLEVTKEFMAYIAGKLKSHANAN